MPSSIISAAIGASEKSPRPDAVQKLAAAHYRGEASGSFVAGGNGRLYQAPAESGGPLRRSVIRAGGLGACRRAKPGRSEKHQQDMLPCSDGSTCRRTPHGVAGHRREGGSQVGRRGCCSSDADAGAIACAYGYRFCGGSRCSRDATAYLQAPRGVWLASLESLGRHCRSAVGRPCLVVQHADGNDANNARSSGGDLDFAAPSQGSRQRYRRRGSQIRGVLKEFAAG